MRVQNSAFEPVRPLLCTGDPNRDSSKLVYIGRDARAWPAGIPLCEPAILFPGQVVQRKQREVYIEGRRVDLLFAVDGVQHIVELKRDTIKREDAGQIFEYYGLLRQMDPASKYRMILVAPTIPPYRRIALEEFGIRCVEVECQEKSEQMQIRSHSGKVESRKNEADPLVEPSKVGLKDIAPPVNSSSLRLSHHLLRDSLPAVQKIFSEYEVVPVRMVNPNHPDVLCLLGSDGRIEQMSRVGAWWAFSLGQSEAMPKNDIPNLSVNALPWGIDIAVNAELRTSQRVMRKKIASSPERFDELVQNHGSLRLEAWLKLEHQPRFYHWIPLLRKNVGEWSGSDLMRFYLNAE